MRYFSFITTTPNHFAVTVQIFIKFIQSVVSFIILGAMGGGIGGGVGGAGVGGVGMRGGARLVVNGFLFIS